MESPVLLCRATALVEQDLSTAVNDHMPLLELCLNSTSRMPWCWVTSCSHSAMEGLQYNAEWLGLLRVCRSLEALLG